MEENKVRKGGGKCWVATCPFVPLPLLLLFFKVVCLGLGEGGLSLFSSFSSPASSSTHHNPFPSFSLATANQTLRFVPSFPSFKMTSRELNERLDNLYDPDAHAISKKIDLISSKDEFNPMNEPVLPWEASREVDRAYGEDTKTMMRTNEEIPLREEQEGEGSFGEKRTLK
jgi:hypothetical protein